MSSNKFALLVAFTLFCFITTNYPQTIKVNLDSLTILDYNGFMFHFTGLERKPKEKLILPPIDTAGVKYITLFYSWIGKGNEHISILIQQKDDADILWVDKNNNENLADDGPPLKFELSSDSIYFDIIPVDDPNQKTRLILYRKPPGPKEQLDKIVDLDGNLNKGYCRFLKNLQDYKWNGEKRTFYFDDRISVRKGIGTFNGKKYLIGLFDYSNNGIFNDSDDVVIIDKDNDNKLIHAIIETSPDETIKLDEIFTLDGINYKISGVDKYGKWIEFASTTEAPNFSYLKYMQKEIADVKSSGHPLQLDESFWNNTFTTINGKNIKAESFKGKYLLLNFWGEWCKPCVMEIPELVKAYNSFPREQFEIIGFLNTNNLKLATTLIKEKGITWANTIASKELLEKFKINSYPTNILIFPDGKTAISNGMISIDFFKNYIK